MRNVEDIESWLSYLDGWGGFRLGLSLPANVLRVSAESAEFFEQLDDGGGGRHLLAWAFAAGVPGQRS